MSLETRPGFTPRLRRGETMPTAPKGKVVTRVHGELVIVSERKLGEPYRGNSAYTHQQIEEISQIIGQQITRRREMRIHQFGAYYE